MIVDTSALLAYFDARESEHEAVSRVIDDADLCIVSPYVVAELDYLVASRYGRAAELSVLNELVEGDWDLVNLDSAQVASIVTVLSGYDQVIGVADASNLVLAQRYGCQQIATLDRKHYSYLHLPGHPPLAILPAV